jgi:hypothetical protein
MEEIVQTHTLAGYNAAGLPLTHTPLAEFHSSIRRFADSDASRPSASTAGEDTDSPSNVASHAPYYRP